MPSPKEAPRENRRAQHQAQGTPVESSQQTYLEELQQEMRGHLNGANRFSPQYEAFDLYYRREATRIPILMDMTTPGSVPVNEILEAQRRVDIYNDEILRFVRKGYQNYRIFEDIRRTGRFLRDETEREIAQGKKIHSFFVIVNT
jgi:hypothetical protein